MKKSIMIALVTVCLFALVGVYSFFKGFPFSGYLMERDVQRYLQKAGYEVSDIASIETRYEMKRTTDRVSGTVAYVTFSDEPKETYIYIREKEGNTILQHCDYYSATQGAWTTDYTSERKHMEKSCTEKL